MRRTASLIAIGVLTVVVLGVALWVGYGPPDERVAHYYEQMRQVPGLEGASDDELTDVAENACRAITSRVEAGESPERAIRSVVASFEQLGLEPGPATSATTIVVDTACPQD